MTITESDFRIDGHQLRRTIFDPPAGVKTVAVCFFTHGQGDYSERYADVLHPFTEEGIRCISVDLLGHGLSSGKRGDCGNIELLDHIIQSNLLLSDGLPYGIAGHSMGGLMTLRYLSLALEGKLPMPSFCWVNSPLLDPTHNYSDWFIKIALILAKIIPQTCIKIGASPDLCRTPEIESIIDGEIVYKKTVAGPQRIAIGWGAQLIHTARSINATLPQKTCDIPFLLTQGDDDKVCPHEITETFFEQLNFTHKRMELFKGMCHETFAEPNKDQLFSMLKTWITQLNFS